MQATLGIQLGLRWFFRVAERLSEKCINLNTLLERFMTVVISSYCLWALSLKVDRPIMLICQSNEQIVGISQKWNNGQSLLFSANLVIIGKKKFELKLHNFLQRTSSLHYIGSPQPEMCLNQHNSTQKICSFCPLNLVIYLKPNLKCRHVSPSLHMNCINQQLVPVKDRHSQQTPREAISKFKPHHLTSARGMESLRKTVVIMCVGEPSTLNACQGLALIVLQCVVLYTSRGHQITN